MQAGAEPCARSSNAATTFHTLLEGHSLGIFSKKRGATTARPEPRDQHEVQGKVTAESDKEPSAQKGVGQDQEASSGSVAPEAPKKTVSQVRGEVTWLLTQSQVHKQLFIGDLEWFAMPPVLLEQFRVFHGKAHPVGVAFWARVSPETDARLREGAFKLRVDEWKGGGIPWLIELIAPFGGQDEMMADLSAAIFTNESYNFHRVAADGRREVATYSSVKPS